MHVGESQEEERVDLSTKWLYESSCYQRQDVPRCVLSKIQWAGSVNYLFPICGLNELLLLGVVCGTWYWLSGNQRDQETASIGEDLDEGKPRVAPI